MRRRQNACRRISNANLLIGGRINNEIRVLAHTVFDSVPHSNQKQLRAFATREFHRGNEVAISGDQNNDLDLPLQSQVGAASTGE